MRVLPEDKGKLVTIKKKDVTYKGYIVNIIEKNNLQELTIKLLDNGYNISVLIDSDTEVVVGTDSKIFGQKQKINITQNPNLPSVALIATGGTIGTHVDYKSGAVSMSRSAEEIIFTVPELLDIINIKKIYSISMKGSEDLGYKDWQKMSESVFAALNDSEIKGVIILHGTDTLAWSGTAISFMIENINKPVLLVGAQKSPDRASFDGAMNLICAARFIDQQVPGVFTVMHGSINDDFCDVIRATKCRKMHSSRRDSFKAINDLPIARVFENGKITYLKDKNILPKPTEKPKINNCFSDSVAILKAYPNSDPKIIEWYIENNYKGLIIEGTGLGHCPIGLGGDDTSFDSNKNWAPYIKKANDAGLIVIITTQCLFGRVNANVYANLRYLKEAGANYLDSHDMLCEVAYIKLCVALARFDKKEEILDFMKTDIAGEISKKEVLKSFELDLL